jgi:hypothetical protein
MSFNDNGHLPSFTIVVFFLYITGLSALRGLRMWPEGRGIWEGAKDNYVWETDDMQISLRIHSHKQNALDFLCKRWRGDGGRGADL